VRVGVVVSVALVLASFAAGVYVYPQVPDRMPSHWNAAGQVDGYMPKPLVLFLIPFGSLVMLVLFLLEMGIVAGSRLGDLRKVGPFLLGFGICMPIVHGALGVWLGSLAGLSIGGATVLGTMAASASYIAAPPAVRVTLPEANPTYSLTASLAITFPFNILAGIPLYFEFARWVQGG
jgi:hypothetical protein